MADIIQDGAKLNAHIVKTLRDYRNVGRAVHIAAVSAVWHACVHGNDTPANELIRGLRPNDASAFRLFIRRAHAIVGLDGADPNNQPSEIINAAVEQGQVFNLQNVDSVPTFSMVRDKNSNQAKALAKLCVDRFINPDGKRDHFLLDRDNVVEVRTLGDEQLLKSLVALAKRIDSETDTKKLAVSDPVKKFLTDIRTKAEVMLGTSTESLAKG